MKCMKCFWGAVGICYLLWFGRVLLFFPSICYVFLALREYTLSDTPYRTYSYNKVVLSITIYSLKEG